MRLTWQWSGLHPDHWREIALCLPRPKKRPYYRKDRRGGRPPIDDKLCFEALVWLMITDGTWKTLPARFGGRRTVQRRLSRWLTSGALARMWRTLLESGSRADHDRFLGRLEAPELRKRAFWRGELDLQTRWAALSRG